MRNLEGKTALVTGASRGIGRAVAEKLGRNGANVVVNYAGNRDKAEEVVRAIQAAGPQAISVQADMSKPDEIRGLFGAAIQKFGAIDIVVSVAATSFFKPIVDVSSDEFDSIFALNVKGVFHVLQEAARTVTNNGRIVQFSTGGTKMPVVGGGVYAATKAAGEQLALALAKELGPKGITVNLISPGVTDTDGLIMPKEAIDSLVAQTPLGRLGQPADVADVVAFLVSDEARWISGQNIQANGGIL
ncbi:MAG: SDR family oxidoreductase [Bryobacteraceae bacterium]|nr:SDR family oxidoreductase [Bryobacteraceae bacterium]